MANENSINLIESQESPEPSYDTSTDTIHDPNLNDGAGGKREPTFLETVKAATRKQIEERDPVERYRAKAEKNLGPRGLERVLDRINEFDNIKDPIDSLAWVAKHKGINPQVAGQYLYNGVNAEGAQRMSEAEAAYPAIDRFFEKYPDPLTQQLRPAAAEHLSHLLNDPRMQGRSHAELLETSFALAWDDLPVNQAARKVQKIMDESDEAHKPTKTQQIKAKMAARAQQEDKDRDSTKWGAFARHG